MPEVRGCSVMHHLTLDVCTGWDFSPIPADFTPIPALILIHPCKKFDPSTQAPAYFLSTKGGSNGHHSGNTFSYAAAAAICHQISASLQKWTGADLILTGSAVVENQ